jgi:hypothetical protein
MLPSFACVNGAAHHDSQYRDRLYAALKDGDVQLADRTYVNLSTSCCGLSRKRG